MAKIWKSYKARPIPEILDGEDWEVRNSGDTKIAYVDFKTRQFVVPFEESATGELVRAHEAMHVKISPHNFKKPGEIDFVTLQSVEDCRVWQGLRMADIKSNNPKARIWSDKDLKKIFETSKEIQNPQRMAEALFCTRGTAEEDSLRKLVEERNPKVVEIVDELAEKYFESKERDGILSEWEDVVDCCREIVKRLKEEIPEFEPPPQAPMVGGRPGDGEGEGSQNGNITFSVDLTGMSGNQPGIGDLTDEERAEGAALGLEDAMGSRSKYAKEFSYRDDFQPPGKIRPIEHPKLDERIRFKTTEGIKMTPADEGIVPVRMHRYATDMKLFSRKGRRRAGAAVLIDCSGSMSLDQGLLLEIIKQCPAAIVALYSGFRNDGILRIVAEDGKYSTALSKGMGGANVIDIPALEWLAKRKEKKKLWISDGWITCINESSPYSEDLRKLANLMRVHKIERVGNVRQLVKSGKLIDKAFDDGHTIGREYKKK